MKNERLAFSNMKKNGNIYFPYLLAGGLLSGLYYMILAVGEMVAGSEMQGGAEMMVILQMCAKLCIVIMFLILFYINSFVMKRRNRELGLYCILGMEKRHLGALLFWEVLLSAAISIAGGILFGVLFSQLMFLILLKLIQIPAKLTFAVPLASVGKTLTVFGVGYLATYLYDLGVICKTDPIRLLKSRQEVLPVFGGQHCIFKIPAEQEKLLLPAGKFHFRIRHAVQDEAECGGACDHRRFVHGASGGAVLFGDAVCRRGRDAERSFPERI